MSCNNEMKNKKKKFFKEFVNPKINLNVCTQFVLECCYLKATGITIISKKNFAVQNHETNYTKPAEEEKKILNQDEKIQKIGNGWITG